MKLIKKGILLALTFCSFTSFSETTDIKFTDGVYYYSTTYLEGEIFTHCFYGYPNNPYTNKTSSWHTLGKRNYYGLRPGDIQRCKAWIAATHRYMD